MSWSIYLAGQPAAVREAAKTQFAKITYLQPDEAEVKDKVAEVVDAALSKYAGKTGVKVTCSGSASSSGGSDPVKTQAVNIYIENLYGWVEPLAPAEPQPEPTPAPENQDLSSDQTPGSI